MMRADVFEGKVIVGHEGCFFQQQTAVGLVQVLLDSSTHDVLDCWSIPQHQIWQRQPYILLSFRQLAF